MCTPCEAITVVDNTKVWKWNYLCIYSACTGKFLLTRTAPVCWASSYISYQSNFRHTNRDGQTVVPEFHQRGTSHDAKPCMLFSQPTPSLFPSQLVLASVLLSRKSVSSEQLSWPVSCRVTQFLPQLLPKPLPYWHLCHFRNVQSGTARLQTDVQWEFACSVSCWRRQNHPRPQQQSDQRWEE